MEKFKGGLPPLDSVSVMENFQKISSRGRQLGQNAFRFHEQ